MTIGAGVAFLFFLLGFAISNVWLWGCAVGVLMAYFGLAFDQ